MPLFDQLIVNRYQPGEGITPHIDLARFEDGIAIVSLGSAAVMQFTLDGLIEPVLLSPGDVLLLCSDARWALSPCYKSGLYFSASQTGLKGEGFFKSHACLSCKPS